MNELAIKIEDVYKQYRLGLIGGATLSAEFQTFLARIRGKEDPNSKIGTKQYAKNEKIMALNGINLEVCQGEVIGIIGRNGAGKSTLLKLISRVTAPTKGTICLNGRVASMLEVGTGFNQEMTGRENVYLNGAILGMTKAEVDRKFDEIVDFSECRQFIDTPVKRYSSGMYVKLAFSVAAHLESEIIIMDEVLAVGDMSFQQKCLEKLRGIADETNRTILYVSHNMSTIRQLCDRCIVLDMGQIVYNGNIETAIQYYMKNFSVMSVVNDLAIKPRSKYIRKRVEMKTLTLEGKTDNFFDSKYPMILSLDWKALTDLDEVYFRFVISYKDSSKMGMLTTCEPLTAMEEKITTTQFSVDLSMFASGIYYADIYCYKSDGMGSVDNLDVVGAGFTFEIFNKGRATNGLQWYHTGWGHAVLPEIKILKV